MWRLHFLSLAALHIGSSTGSIAWTQDNCNMAGTGGAMRGQVTDAICAKFSLCSNINDQFSDLLRRKDACDTAVYCLWRPELGRCVYNRDSQNNVCVPAEEVANLNPNCHNITQGICPLNWQVKRECCQDTKYDGKLQTQAGESWVCCNTPCDSLYNSTVSLPARCSWADHAHVDQCGPNGRSLLGVDRRGKQHVPGLERSYSPNHLSAALGLAPSQAMMLGQVVPGFSGLGSLPPFPFPPSFQLGLGVQTYSPGMLGSLPGLPVLQQAGVRNQAQQTEEITVDDVMNLLIDSLATDDDMFEYKAELNSDPWYGKRKTGGPGDSIKFINPNSFINQLYSTPYGLTTGNWQAGAQNIPVPQVAGMLPYGSGMFGYPGAFPVGGGGVMPGYPGTFPAGGGRGSALPFGFTLPTGSSPQQGGYQQQQSGYGAPQQQQSGYGAPQQQQSGYGAPQQQQGVIQQQQGVNQQQLSGYGEPLLQQQLYQAPQLAAAQPPQQQLPYQIPQQMAARQPVPATQQQQLPYQIPQQPAAQPQQQMPLQPPVQQQQRQQQINPYIPPPTVGQPQQQQQVNPYIPPPQQQRQNQPPPSASPGAQTT